MEKKRLDYLDMAKGLGMLLVLMGHLQGDSIYQFSPYLQPWCVFIFSFHMPMFFIISGILMAIKDDDKKDFKQLAKKRFKGIMVPYYWFSFFYMTVVVFELIRGNILIQTFLINLWYVISGYGMNVLWFLPALYLGELLFIFLRQKTKSEKSYIIILLLSLIVTFILSYLLTLPKTEAVEYKRFREIATVILRPVMVCGFISLGYYVHKLLEKESKIGDFFLRASINEKGNITVKYRILYFIISLVLIGICAAFTHVNNGIDFRTMAFRNVFFFLLCCISGSYGVILLCKALPQISLVTFWGKGSLIFMATHNSQTVLKYALLCAMYVNQYLTRARGYICYLIVVAIITAFSSLMILLITKFAPFITGKPFRFKKDNN